MKSKKPLLRSSAVQASSPMNGVLNVNKPSGMTSHDVVQQVRRILGEQRVGHTGTLDPLATGVLVLCIGKATRLAQYLEAGEKEYRAVLRLGITTDTLDSQGRLLETRSYVAPSRDEIVSVAQRFIGTIMQRPPAFSAVKTGGVPSYKLARQGKAEPNKPRPVSVHAIELTGFTDPFVSITVRCAKGVYIRSICADIGDALGMGAHLTSLVRTRSGRFDLRTAVALEDLAARMAAGDLEKTILPVDEALADIPSLSLSDVEAARVSHGNHISRPASGAVEPGSLLKLHDHAGALIALARLQDGTIRPELVFSAGL